MIMIIISIFWFMSASIGFPRSYLAVQFSSKVVLPIENKTYRFCLFTYFLRIVLPNEVGKNAGRKKSIDSLMHDRNRVCVLGTIAVRSKQMRFHHRSLRNLLSLGLSWELASKGLWIARPPRVCSSRNAGHEKHPSLYPCFRSAASETYGKNEQLGEGKKYLRLFIFFWGSMNNR